MVTKRRESRGKMKIEEKVSQTRLEAREMEVWDEVPPPSLQRRKGPPCRKAAFKWKSPGVACRPLTPVSLNSFNG